MTAFPWTRLQVLDAPSCLPGGECKVNERAVISVDGAATVGEALTLDTSNSPLNHPRAEVSWDWTATARTRRRGGRAVTTTFTPATAGAARVGVQIRRARGGRSQAPRS
jgi:hypothetical protein